MASKNLSSAAKRQNPGRGNLGNAAKDAAKKAAANLAGGKKTAISQPSSTTTTTQTTQATSTAITTDIQVPGLVGITPDAIAGMMPAFNQEVFAISDPLNPPESMPQQTIADRARVANIYQGGMRALDSYGDAFDLTAKRFTVVGKQAKAWGAGIQMATEFEKVRGNYTDYLNQKENNEQKAITYDLNQTKTISDRNSATYKKEEINQKEEQARLASEKAKLDTQKKQAEFDGLKAELGALPAAS